MSNSISMKKRVKLSMFITLFLMLFLLFPFFIHINNKEIVRYYPLASMDDSNSLEFHDYEIDKNNFTTMSNDSWIYMQLEEDVNLIYIDFLEVMEDSIDLKVYFSNNENFNESQVKNLLITPGIKEAKINLDQSFANIRLDIGNHQGQSFSLDKIVLSQSQSNIKLFTEIILSSLVLFGISFLVLRLDNLISKLRLLYQSSFFQNNRVFIYGIFIFTALFCVLFFKYIYLNEAYIFSDGDISGDTLDGIYASYYATSEKLHNGDFSLYSLRTGFGMSSYNIFSILFQPFELITVLFPLDMLEKGILLSVYLRLFAIMIFAIKYFKLFYKDYRVIISSSLLWTFCSYVIIWGQQYGFASNMVYFTMFNYYLQLLCLKKRNGIGVVITLALISFSGYYFFYSIGVYSIIYICVYEVLGKRNVKEFYTFSLKLLIYAFIAIGISAFVLLPNICMFLDSARPDAISNLSHNLFSFLDVKAVVSMIGRLLSPNLLGTALDGTIYSNVYEGLNYYEMAFLSVSILSLFAINHFFYTEKRKRVLYLICIIICISLTTFLVSFILTFGYNFRWVYMIAFLETILISRYLNIVLNQFDIKVSKIVNIRTIVMLTILTVSLVFADILDVIVINYKIILITWLFAIIYATLTSIKKMNNIIVLLIMFELLFSNFGPVSQRGTENINDLHNKYYFDGTKESIESLTEHDSDVYRINKTYISRFYNDAYVQGYNGMSVYTTMNSAVLKELLNTYDVYESYNHPNYFKVDYDNLFLNGLFGVRYFISDQSQSNMQKFINAAYPIYENPYALPFGFLYDQKINISEITSKDKIDYIYTGYFDETSKGNDAGKIWSEQSYVIDPVTQGTYNIAIPNQQSNYVSINIKYKVNTPCITNVKVYVNGKVEKDYNYTSTKADNDVKINLPYQSKLGNDIKIEISFIGELVEASPLNCLIKLYDESKIKEYISHYQKQSLVIEEYEGDYIKGSIINLDMESKMLFIPIVYSDEWYLKVDGRDEQVRKINGGFVGVLIPNGKHTIELSFIPKGLKLGLSISIGTCIFIIVFYSINKVGRLKKYKCRR